MALISLPYVHFQREYTFSECMSTDKLRSSSLLSSPILSSHLSIHMLTLHDINFVTSICCICAFSSLSPFLCTPLQVSLGLYRVQLLPYQPAFSACCDSNHSTSVQSSMYPWLGTWISLNKPTVFIKPALFYGE